MKAASVRVPINKGAKLPGEVLEAWEVIALIRACGRGPAGVRNAALIAIMFGAGLRVSEALALKVSDLNLNNGTVRVRHGKGDRARTVAIDASAQAYVERWLGRRERLGLNGRQPLFCTISKGDGFGGPIDSSYVRKALPRLAARAGLDRRVHPHALRHSLATALAHEGKSLPTITAQLGHSSTAVTDRYLAKIAPADLIAQVRDRGRLESL
jgi:integrase/recombinase XerD